MSIPSLDALYSVSCDTGAQKTAVGLKMLLHIVKWSFYVYNYHRLMPNFYGDRFCKSLRITDILLHTPTGSKLIRAHLVAMTISLLLELGMSDNFQWNVLIVEIIFLSASERSSLPLVRKFGHVFLLWPKLYSILYTCQQLQNLHLHLMHPSSENILHLLQRTYPSRNRADTSSLLDNITKACHACQAYFSKSLTL